MATWAADSTVLTCILHRSKHFASVKAFCIGQSILHQSKHLASVKASCIGHIGQLQQSIDNSSLVAQIQSTTTTVMEKSARKRKAISINDKIKLIEESRRPGYNQSKAAQSHNMSQSTLAGILKSQDSILTVANKMSSSKRHYRGREDQLEQELHAWFLKKRAQRLPIDDPLVRRQAEIIAKEMGLETALTFSHGWLMRWRKRFGINCRQQHGEKDSADVEGAKKWLEEKLPDLLQEYSPEDIFNADETGLYYRGLANRTLVTKGEKPAGTKTAKERLTLLVCTNMTGSEKPKLLVIGKSARPRGFPRNLSALPVQWESTKKAWMTGQVWVKMLNKWDMELRLQSRHILLLIDNAPSHPEVVGLTNIKVVYLPKNTTSLIQPCDAGIIHNLKAYYQMELRDRILASLEAAGAEKGRSEDFVKKVSILDAIHMVARAWRSVKATTVANCFQKALSLDKKAPTITDIKHLDAPLPDGMTSEQFEAFLDEDDMLDDTQDDKEEENIFPKDKDEAEVPQVGHKECLHALADVRIYAQSRGLDDSILYALKRIETECLSHKVEFQKQSCITQFFSK